jgi:hypothetical protein
LQVDPETHFQLFLGLCLIAASFARPVVFLGYQDSLGQYSFGYSAPGSARSEVRTSDGAIKGTYSYIDETGIIQIAEYVADSANGFRVTATNLPQAPLPVQDTPEVMAARIAHLQALEMAMRRDEVAQGGAEERKIAGKRNGADETQEQPEGRSTGELWKVEQQQGDESENGELREENRETSMQVFASKSSVDEGSERYSQHA